MRFCFCGITTEKSWFQLLPQNSTRCGSAVLHQPLWIVVILVHKSGPPRSVPDVTICSASLSFSFIKVVKSILELSGGEAWSVYTRQTKLAGRLVDFQNTTPGVHLYINIKSTSGGWGQTVHKRFQPCMTESSKAVLLPRSQLMSNYFLYYFIFCPLISLAGFFCCNWHTQFNYVW